ncbi:MAG: hypothetical protein SVK08_01900 [Halobacteriota archaeon]|nr:hypothetical protein [Halobacteriota archaeon]
MSDPRERLTSIKVDTKRLGISVDEQDIVDSIRDYNVENYDVVRFQCEFFDYEAIFQNDETVILHFKLRPHYQREIVFKAITKLVRDKVAGRCISIESDWQEYFKSLDIILVKFNATMGGKDRYFHAMARQAKEKIAMSI